MERVLDALLLAALLFAARVNKSSADKPFPIYARTLHRIKGLIANSNGYFHAFSATASRQLTRRVAYFVCADINGAAICAMET